MMDGGPAFPRIQTIQVENSNPDAPPTLLPCYDYEGMSLRDWFAGQALSGLAESGVIENYEPLHIARVCCQLADAVLAELERAKPKPKGKGC